MTIFRSTLAFLLCLVLSTPVCGDSVRMRSSVRLPDGALEVRLGDIAELNGAVAEAFNELLIATLHDCDVLQLTVDDVRTALTDAGAHWGKLNLSGRKTIVRSKHGVRTAEPRAMQATTIDQVSSADASPVTVPVTAARWVSENTIRGLIVARLAGALDVRPVDLQIQFEQRDRALLDRQLTSARFEIEPISRFDGPRVELVIREWPVGVNRTTGPIRHAIAAGLLLHREVVVATRAINRGEPLTAQNMTIGSDWIAPDRASLLASAESVSGRLAGRRIREREMIRLRDLALEAVMQRGEMAVVRCIVGGHVISFKAEAREDGGLGETISFRRPGERSEFTARVAGPGEAIVEVNE